MKVHILSAYPEAPENPINFQARWMRESAGLDPFGVHTLCDSPAAADLVLFVENHPAHDPLFFQVRQHPVLRRFREKSFLYHDSDYAYPFVPGLYPSLIKADYAPHRCRSAHYVGRIESHQALRYEPLSAIPSLLFSFMGARNSLVRERVLGLKHHAAVLADTSNGNLWSSPDDQKRAYMERYGQVINDSAFVLCPEGIGTSTYRLYETMEAGRVPVIISDSWVPPEGPVWTEFSVRVPEDEIDSIPHLLETLRPRWSDMSSNARAVWEQWFSKPVAFHRMTEWCSSIIRDRELTALLPRAVYNLRLNYRHKRQLGRFLRRTLKTRLTR